METGSRVVSLVPSWTESLIEWGANVVGRTRFCIHPENKISGIQALGGTKNPDFAKLRALQPDLLIVDKEENTKDILENFDGDIHVSHVQSLWDMPIELQRLAQTFIQKGDLEVAARILKDRDRAEALLNRRPQLDLIHLPGVIKWLRPIAGDIETVLYLIWKDPWMTVSKETYIGSLLGYLGLRNQLPDFDQKYPQLALEPYLNPKTLLLFSSEPFPFLKKEQALMDLPCAMAFVDGESYSWFGIRSLKFLESVAGVSKAT